jgi:DNA-binding Lrp family transcriptional regulator
MKKSSNKNSDSHETPALDKTDRALLQALAKNARLTNKELAAKVGLAPSSCLQRVRRLVNQKIIRGFSANIDPRAIGIGLQAMVSLRLERHARPLYLEFRTFVAELTEVIAVYHITGREDFLIHVAVRDPEHLQAFVVEKLAARPEVGHLETALIFEYQPSATPPFYPGDPANKS